jgi:hypothetical protein
MFVSDLFPDDNAPLSEGKYPIPELDDVAPHHIQVLQRLAKFHRIPNLEFDRSSHQWTATPSKGLYPFIKDARHITSAAAMGGLHEDDRDGRKLVAIYTKMAPQPHKVYVWATGANKFELEYGHDQKRVPLALSIQQIKQTLVKNGWKSLGEGIEEDWKGVAAGLGAAAAIAGAGPAHGLNASRPIDGCGNTVSNPYAHKCPPPAPAKKAKVDATTMAAPVVKPPVKKTTEAYVSAGEKKMNPGVEVGNTVSIKAPQYEWMVKFGKFDSVGPSGLANIILNTPLPNDQNVPADLRGSRKISVPVSWLFKDVDQAWPKPDYSKPRQKSF